MSRMPSSERAYGDKEAAGKFVETFGYPQSGAPRRAICRVYVVMQAPGHQPGHQVGWGVSNAHQESSIECVQSRSAVLTAP
jgi:hypothetical protein